MLVLLESNTCAWDCGGGRSGTYFEPRRRTGSIKRCKNDSSEAEAETVTTIDKTDKEAHGVGWGVDLDYEK